MPNPKNEPNYYEFIPHTLADLTTIDLAFKFDENPLYELSSVDFTPILKVTFVTFSCLFASFVDCHELKTS